MVASIKPHRDEVGLAGGRMLIDGRWVAAADEAAIESYTELKTVLLPFTGEMM